MNASKLKRRLKLDVTEKKQLVILASIIGLVVLFDQITKIWAASSLIEGMANPIWGEFLQFKLVYNLGGALGTNIGGTLFYLVSSSLILLIVIYFTYSYRNYKVIAISLAVISGGAIGNIIDRFRLGKVIDFIDVDFFDISLFGNSIERWWIFNIADAAISVGVVFLLIYIFFSKQPGPVVSEESPIQK